MRIEELVNDITAYIIERAEDLSIESLAYIYNIQIAFNHVQSCYMHKNGHDIIFIKFGTEQEMWHSFAHELVIIFYMLVIKVSFALLILPCRNMKLINSPYSL